MLPVSVAVELRAPTRDGAVVALPPLGEIGSLLAGAHVPLGSRDLLGRPWKDLREQARQGAIEAGRAYLRGRGEPVPDGNPATVLAAGHQPELFHPGVWVKNFALAGLAQAHHGTSLNLIVDNDTVKSTALHVPRPPGPEHPYPQLLTCPYDHWNGETYEEQTIRDPELFRGFGDSVCALLRGWNYEPLLAAFWPEVLRECGNRSGFLHGCHPGEAFAAARRTLERRWGCHNLEVPLSHLCRTEPFAWFACHLLADLPRFHSIYNDRVHDYRRSHGIRSRNHPVPDLATDGDWLETPFWGWRTGQPRRHRLFARHNSGQIELRTSDLPWPSLPFPSRSSGTAAVQTWLGLELSAYKVRSRALTTTLYTRLFVSDLFIHGIGGGKYDELTDAICEHFYGIPPPPFVVLSATRLLPLPLAPVSVDERRRLIRELRDLHYKPQRFLTNLHGHLDDLVKEKQVWMARQPTESDGRRERFLKLRALNEQLREPLHDREEATRAELARSEKHLEANAVLQRRDYAFCLYPEELLRPFCRQFLARGM
jgi:hypothetical protein